MMTVVILFWITILTKQLAGDSYSILIGETEGVSKNFFDCCNEALKQPAVVNS